MRGAGRGAANWGALWQAWSHPWCSLQLMKRSSKAEEYMQQSLPYLRDSQSSVRLAAVRFIGESQPLAPFGATPTTLCRASASLCPLPQPGLAGCIAQSHSPWLLVAPGMAVGGWQGRGSPCWERSGSRE